ncbi:MAG: hypothetical protein AAFV88_02910 [Planctomycetota bacterium]
MLRFQLRSLLLFTLAIAVWLPGFFFWKEKQSIESDLRILRQLSPDLAIIDEDKICIRVLPSVWSNITSWRYYLPEDTGMEIHLASEGINSLGAPREFQSMRLPAGIHRLDLKSTTKNGERNHVLYLDREVVISQNGGVEFDSYSTSSTSGVTNQSSAYPLDESLVLKTSRIIPMINGRSLQPPEECDAVGCRIWMSPTNIEQTEAPNFMSPGDRLSAWGNRNGVRVLVSQNQQRSGRLGIQSTQLQGAYATRGSLQSLSVRPVYQGKALLPETLPWNQETPSIEVLDENEAKETFARTKDQVKVTARYAPFDNGVHFEVDLLFDANRPNQVGLLPRALDGSPAVDGWEILTLMDRQFHLHQLETGTEIYELDALDSKGGPPEAWKKIPFANPESSEPNSYQSGVTFKTSIKDYRKILNRPRSGQLYSGAPIQQRWIVPNDASASVFYRRRPLDEPTAIDQPPPNPSLDGPQATLPEDTDDKWIHATKVKLPATPQDPVWFEIRPID